MSETLDAMTNEELGILFPIILTEYNPVWEKNYHKEKIVVEQAIGLHNIVRISHIGSTAIPGSIAKPTVDVLVEIKDGIDTARLISNMELGRYRYLEQPKKPPPHMMFIKGYTPEGFKGQAFHIHIRYNGDWDELYFRDYLLVHPETVADYGRLKLKLKKKYEYDRDAYTDAKTDFIQRITELARADTQNK